MNVDWWRRTEVIAGVIVTIIAVAGFLGLRAQKKLAETTFNYVGTVVDASTNKTLSNVTVTIYEDNKDPQSDTTGSKGVWSVHLDNNATTVSIRATASGYLDYTDKVNPHRIGPELIRMKPESHSAHRSAKPNTSSHPIEGRSPVFSQTCSGQSSCFGQVFGNVNVTPGIPKRQLDPDAEQKAYDYLRGNFSHGRMRVELVGTTRETQQFASQLVYFFSFAGWTTFYGINTLNYYDFFNPLSPRGEGIHCNGTGDLAETARQALALLGFPCNGTFVPTPITSGESDFAIMVGPPLEEQ